MGQASSLSLFFISMDRLEACPTGSDKRTGLICSESGHMWLAAATHGHLLCLLPSLVTLFNKIPTDSPPMVYIAVPHSALRVPLIWYSTCFPDR